MGKTTTITAVVFATAILSGCGKSSDAALSGTISLQGKPLAAVTVTLIAETGGDKFVGTSDPEGKLSIPTGRKAVSGAFKVVVVDPLAGRGGRGNDPYIADQNIPKNPPIPPKFGAEQTTTARVTIELGKPVTIDLTP